MARARQRSSANPWKLATDQRRISIKRGRDPLLIAEHERHVKPSIRQCRIMRKQPLDDIRAPIQSCANQPRAAIAAISRPRLRVFDQRRPRIEPKLGRHRSLRIRQPRAVIIAHPCHSISISRSSSAQQLLRTPTRLLKINLHHDLLQRRPVLAAHAPE